MIQKKFTFIVLAGLLSLNAAHAATAEVSAALANAALNSPSNLAIYQDRAQDFTKVVNNTTARPEQRQMLANVLIARSNQSIQVQTSSIYGGAEIAAYLKAEIQKIADKIRRFQFNAAHAALLGSWSIFTSK